MKDHDRLVKALLQARLAMMPFLACYKHFDDKKAFAWMLENLREGSFSDLVHADAMAKEALESVRAQR